MGIKRSIISATLLIYWIGLFAQLPSQTVVFKVRKGKKAEVVEQRYIAVEEPATFRGGDINTFKEWVQQNMAYPLDASNGGISGKVVIKFVVDTIGKVYEVSVVRGVHPSIDREAIRAVCSSPQWKPARQNGKPVAQFFYLPVVFSLQ